MFKKKNPTETDLKKAKKALENSIDLQICDRIASKYYEMYEEAAF